MRRRFFPMARRGGARPPRAFGTGSRRPRPCPNPRWPTAPGVTARNATRPAAVAPAPGGAQRDGAAGGGTGGGGGGAGGAPRPRGRRPGRRRWLTAGVGAGFRPAAAHGGAGLATRGFDRRRRRAAAGEKAAATAPPTPVPRAWPRGSGRRGGRHRLGAADRGPGARAAAAARRTGRACLASVDLRGHLARHGRLCRAAVPRAGRPPALGSREDRPPLSRPASRRGFGRGEVPAAATF